MAKRVSKASIISNTSFTGSCVVDLMCGEAHTGVYAALKAGADMLIRYMHWCVYDSSLSVKYV